MVLSCHLHRLQVRLWNLTGLLSQSNMLPQNAYCLVKRGKHGSIFCCITITYNFYCYFSQQGGPVAGLFILQHLMMSQDHSPPYLNLSSPANTHFAELQFLTPAFTLHMLSLLSDYSLLATHSPCTNLTFLFAIVRAGGSSIGCITDNAFSSAIPTSHPPNS